MAADRRGQPHLPGGRPLAWVEEVEPAECLAAAIPIATFRVMPGAWHDWEPAPMASALVELATSG